MKVLPSCCMWGSRWQGRCWTVGGWEVRSRKHVGVEEHQFPQTASWGYPVRTGVASAGGAPSVCWVDQCSRSVPVVPLNSLTPQIQSLWILVHFDRLMFSLYFLLCMNIREAASGPEGSSLRFHHQGQTRTFVGLAQFSLLKWCLMACLTLS